MVQEQRIEDLVNFFKALAEPQRLKIVGLLAQRPHTVADVARKIGVTVSTASHHLARLADAGLVSARAEGYYNLYVLKAETVTALARTLLADAGKRRRPEREGVDAFERKVLDTFTAADGRIRAFPVQEKKFLVLVRHVLKAFEHGVRYPEKRVNQILKNYSDDTARLRRALVDHGYMAREGGGGKYWRIMIVALLLALTGGNAPAQSPAEPQTRPAAAGPHYGTFAFTDSLRLPGSPEEIYDAITGDISGWWDHSFSKKPARLTIEARPGGGFYEIFDERGDGALHATVILAQRGKTLRFEGPLGLSGKAITMVTTYSFAPSGTDSTMLLLEVHAAGEMQEGLGGIVRSVWRHFLVDRFLPYVSAGKHRTNAAPRPR